MNASSGFGSSGKLSGSSGFGGDARVSNSKPKAQLAGRGIGQFGDFGEASDEQSLSRMMSQKQVSQQGSAPVQQAIGYGQGGAAAASDFGSNESSLQQTQKASGINSQNQSKTQKPPLPVGNFAQELITRPLKSIKESLHSFFDLSSLLNINYDVDSPQAQAKKRAIHQRYQQLTQEEQQEAQRQYQEELEKKQKEEQEAQEKRRQEEQKNSQPIQAPAGQKKGPDLGGGSRKQRAQTKLQNDRKQLGGPSDIG
jgi:hypothetical protein